MRFGIAKSTNSRERTQGRLQDLHGLRVLRVARVGLQIVLGHVGRVRHPPVDETQLAGELGQPRDFGGARARS